MNKGAPISKIAIAFTVEVLSTTALAASVIVDETIITTLFDTPTDASSILDIRSTKRGVLLPRLPHGNVMDPAEGLMLFDSDEKQLYFYTNDGWKALSGSAQ